MPHILLVEDDPANLYMLQAAIQFEGFTTTQAVSGAEALQKIERDSIDAVLLDLGLPDLAGSHLIERIRAITDVPIIVVSGRSDEPFKIAALDAGADHFVQKPVMHGELLARVRAVLRRYDRTRNRPPQNGTQHPPHPAQPQRTIALGPMREKLLDVLRAHDGEIVSAGEIISEVWGSESKGKERNLRVLVATTRTQLLAEGEPFAIVNVHGRGYRMVPNGHHAEPRAPAPRGRLTA